MRLEPLPLGSILIYTDAVVVVVVYTIAVGAVGAVVDRVTSVDDAELHIADLIGMVAVEVDSTFAVEVVVMLVFVAYVEYGNEVEVWSSEGHVVHNAVELQDELDASVEIVTNISGNHSAEVHATLAAEVYQL